MNAQTLTFTADEQTLTKTDSMTEFASNTVSYIEATFTLGTNWTGYDSVRAVWKTDYYTISTVLDANYTCVVPTEILMYKAKVYVNLVGSIASGDTLTDRITTFPVLALTVKAKAEVEGTETATVTASQFDQYVATVQSAASAITDYSYDSEAWAVGTRGGVAVTSGDDTYENNSKYWAEEAASELSDLKADLKPIEDFVTPEMYGAVGDGVTDDTQALQNMFDLSTGTIVLNGKYLVTSTVTSSKPRNMISFGGTDSYIHGLSSGSMLAFVRDNDDVNGYNNNYIVNVNVYNSGTGHGVSFENWGDYLSNMYISNCQFYANYEASTGYGLYCDNSMSHSLIVNSRFRGNGIYGNFRDANIIFRCSVYGKGNGIVINPAAYGCLNNSIKNCTIVNTVGNAIQIIDGEQITIENNQIEYGSDSHAQTATHKALICVISDQRTSEHIIIRDNNLGGSTQITSQIALVGALDTEIYSNRFVKLSGNNITIDSNSKRTVIHSSNYRTNNLSSSATISEAVCEDNGEETVIKTGVDGYYPQMTVGAADQLIATQYVEDSVPYNFRTTGGSADVGNREYVDAIVGGTIAWNQLVDSDTTSVTVTSGHEYISYISSAWDIGTSDGTAITVDGSSGDMLFDITLMFGSTVASYYYGLGSDSCVSWFCGLFPKTSYEYNAGELMSVNVSEHNTVGFNAFDYSTGEAVLVGGNAYQITGTYTSVSYTDISGDSETLTIDSDGYFTPTNNGTLTVTGGDDSTTCVHLVWTGYRDDEFEEYSARSYALDSSLTLRGIPMLSDSYEIYYDGDTYEYDGTVTRKYGVVDLGSLSWYATSAYFYAYPQNVENPEIYYCPNAICSEYVAGKWDSNKSDGHFYIFSDAVRIYDSAYSTTEAFKTAMSGVYLVYELATPTTETADPYQQVQVCDALGTEQFVDYSEAQGTRDVSVPCGHLTKFPVNLRDKLQDLIDLMSAPSTDGTYALKCTVSSGTATYTWESET